MHYIRQGQVAQMSEIAAVLGNEAMGATMESMGRSFEDCATRHVEFVSVVMMMVQTSSLETPLGALRELLLYPAKTIMTVSCLYICNIHSITSLDLFVISFVFIFIYLYLSFGFFCNIYHRMLF